MTHTVRGRPLFYLKLELRTRLRNACTVEALIKHSLRNEAGHIRGIGIQSLKGTDGK